MILNETETRYYVMNAKVTPQRFRHAVRAHWSVENSLYWILDGIMNEDSQCNRTGDGPENLALTWRPALNIAGVEPGKVVRQVKTVPGPASPYAMLSKKSHPMKLDRH